MQIKFDDVFYEYKALSGKNIQALKGITVDLSKNEIVAIVGHTGSGKSTAMQHVNGLLQPTAGTVRVGDVTITSKKNKYIESVRKHIGYVFQNPHYQLFASTVLEDVMYGPINFGQTEESSRSHSIEALQQVGIEDSLYDRYPFDLSGGQMRKVAIAGSLSYGPDLLVLDEPTVGLDPLSTMQMVKLFKELHETAHKSLLFITHDMEFVAELAHRVLVFDQGQIVFDGTPYQLFSDAELAKRYAIEIPTLYELYLKLQEKLPELEMNEQDLQSIETFSSKLQQLRAK